MIQFKPIVSRDIPRSERVICLDIGLKRKMNLKSFCVQHNVAMTDMIKQMIDHCISTNKGGQNDTRKT